MPTDMIIKCYKFDELNEKAKKNAIEWMREQVNGSGEIDTDIKDFFKERLTDVGLGSLKTHYSLSCSQGDGVAFEGDINIAEFLDGQYKLPAIVKNMSQCNAKFQLQAMVIEEKIYDKISNEYCENGLGIRVMQHGRYCHSNSMSIEVTPFIDNASKSNGLSESETIAAYFDNYFRLLSQMFERLGYAIIDDMCSDEQLIEQINGSDFLFTEQGFRSFDLG